MGLFDMLGAREAHGRVYGGGTGHGDVTHELLAGAAGFEAMRMYEHHGLGKELIAGFAAAEVDKHFDQGRYGHLDREQARMMARQQAHGLFDHRGW